MTVGRPGKLTNLATEDITDGIRLGMPLSASARRGGISYRTFLNWYQEGEAEEKRLEDGEKPDKKKAEYLQFFHKVEEAKADAAQTWTQTIYDASQRDPGWAKYMLSKWFPEEHGEQAQRIELTGKDGGAIKTDATVTDERRVTELVALLDRARERSGGAADSGTGDNEELTG